MKRILAVFVLLVIGISVALWIKVHQTEAAHSGPPGGSGVVEGTEVQVSSRISARILTVAVREGDRVTAGQLLVTLDCREQAALLELSKSRLTSAEVNSQAAQLQGEAALNNARAASMGITATGAQSSALKTNREATSRQVARLQRLRGEGGATESDLDHVTTQMAELGERLKSLDANTRVAQNQATAARLNAQAIRRQVDAAMAGIRGAKADLLRSQTMMEECSLRSPIDGVVLAKARQPGEVTLPGAALLTLVRLDEVETVFYLPNAELAAVKPGTRAEVRADAYPARVFRGTVAAIAAEAEFTPRNIQTREDRDRLVYAVRVRLQNPDQALRPGMPVEVAVPRAAQ